MSHKRSILGIVEFIIISLEKYRRGALHRPRFNLYFFYMVISFFALHTID